MGITYGHREQGEGEREKEASPYRTKLRRSGAGNKRKIKAQGKEELHRWASVGEYYLYPKFAKEVEDKRGEGGGPISGLWSAKQ